MGELPRPSHERERSTSEPSMVAKCRYSPSVLVFKELKIKQSAIAVMKAAEDGVPTALALVAFFLSVSGRPDRLPVGLILTMCELNMSVLEWEVFLWKLLQSDDDVISWSLCP